MTLNSEAIKQLAIAVIETEAQAVSALASRINDDFTKACEYILNCKGRVVVLGMGKSGHIGGKIMRQWDFDDSFILVAEKWQDKRYQSPNVGYIDFVRLGVVINVQQAACLHHARTLQMALILLDGTQAKRTDVRALHMMIP